MIRLMKDRLLRRPRLARMILFMGALGHFVLCFPLFGRRGFPEVDPFWLAMIWLWVPAIPLSAIHDKWSRGRAYALLVYALATGFTVSWGTIMIVPSHKSPFGALRDLLVLGPVMILCVAFVEGVSRLVIARMRRFIPEPFCEHCGYNLRGLRDPRCPECGTPFPAELLTPDALPSPTPAMTRWTTGMMVLVLLSSAVFPFVYRAYTFHSVAKAGERWAEVEWAQKMAKWYVTSEELQAMTPAQRDRFEEMLFRQHSVMEIRRMWSDWYYATWESAYRRTIEGKMKESGVKPPSFD